jgi:fatty-acyl-CoA synthase
VAAVGAGNVAAPWPCIRFDAFDAHDPPAPAAQDDLDAPVLLYATSGTTKGPKLVAHSQATLAWHATSISTALALSAERHSLLAMLPFCGTFGMSALLGLAFPFTYSMPSIPKSHSACCRTIRSPTPSAPTRCSAACWR